VYAQQNSSQIWPRPWIVTACNIGYTSVFHDGGGGKGNRVDFQVGHWEEAPALPKRIYYILYATNLKVLVKVLLINTNHYFYIKLGFTVIILKIVVVVLICDVIQLQLMIYQDIVMQKLFTGGRDW
jgi:hypothetical protein